jgi:hypothetical protein
MFLRWVDTIERIVQDSLNVGLLDLSDQDYMMMFEDESDPQIVANNIINDANFIVSNE